MSRFNLIDEKWIPVRFPDGTRQELGIREILLRSTEIDVIEDSSPLVVAALHRLLLAVLYRALEGPTDIDQAKALFNSGLPGERITAYLEKWRARFWLFDDQYPFWQIPTFEAKTWRAWTALAAEHNANNAKVLFDHIKIGDAGSIPAPVAARWLMACQTFALGGGNSEFVYTKSAPSATAAVVLPSGKNLHDTLLLCLVPESKIVLDVDRPIWEQEPVSLGSLKNGFARPANGFADLYTWLSRSVKFRLDGSDATVSELAFASGIECSLGAFVDPMLGYRIHEKYGRLPVQFRERGLWRDFDSLLPDNAGLAPQVIDNAIKLTQSNRERFPRSVSVFGQANDKAKIEYWRMERFALPEALVGDRFVRTEIRQLLTDAEVAQQSLWKACCSFASNILSRGNRKPAAKDIGDFVDQMAVSARYWSVLESRFHEILQEYTLARDSEDLRLQWLVAVRDTLKETWAQHCASVATGDAWAIRALVNAEGMVGKRLKALSKEISELDTHKEEDA